MRSNGGGGVGTDGACAPSVGFAATSPVKNGGGSTASILG